MLNMRLKPELKARLERLAERDHRTVSNLVEIILERACDEAERKRR
jgi:predicted DNA-binding protein